MFVHNLILTFCLYIAEGHIYVNKSFRALPPPFPIFSSSSPLSHFLIFSLISVFLLTISLSFSFFPFFLHTFSFLLSILFFQSSILPPFIPFFHSSPSFSSSSPFPLLFLGDLWMALNTEMPKIPFSLYRYVSDHRMCCHVENLEECITLTPQPPLFVCGSLMQHTFLRACLWLIGFIALAGNAMIIIMRIRKTPTKSSTLPVQSLLVCNLGIADFLMGVYMIIIAGADAHFGKDYFLISDQWRSGSMCKFAGFLVFLANEASVFFITLISIDCLMQFKFTAKKVTTRVARFVVIGIWIFSFLLSVISISMVNNQSDVYGLSDVCLGLPLVTRPSHYTILEKDIGNPFSDQSLVVPVPDNFKPTWHLSIAVFLGINSICLIIIMICYVWIFAQIRHMNYAALVKDENVTSAPRYSVQIAKRMALIVGTDFLCWMPIILMGILSQTGQVVIPPSTYVWAVVFILPINSCLNPFIYTFLMYSGFRGRSVTDSEPVKDTGPAVFLAKETTGTSMTVALAVNTNVDETNGPQDELVDN